MINEQPHAGERACERCGSHFVCGIATGEDRCWCFDLPLVMKSSPDAACLCPGCLREAIETEVKDD